METGTVRRTSERARALMATALAILLAAVVVVGVVVLVLPAGDPPAVAPSPPPPRRLARRLLLVVVDGLRFDVATDPLRMPRFAEAMRRETSAELWAGRVSM